MGRSTPEANDPNLGTYFRQTKFIFWRFVMKRISILVLILCACFVLGHGASSPCARLQLDRVPQAKHDALEPV